MVTPKISVCVVTYNQVGYIRKCIDSIMNQEVDCDFEVIVSDDFSTDGTRDVLVELAEQYGKRIQVLLQEKNIGPINNYFAVHNLAIGDYVCHLDGDDFCLAGKLQVLKVFLDDQPECNIVWHRMVILNEKGQTAVGMPVTPITEQFGTNKFYVKDLAKYYGMTGCHSGSMYRRSAKKLTAYPFPTIDYFFTLSFLQDGGYASYINEPYGVYRFFQQDQTLTRQKGGMYVGLAKLDFIENMLRSNPNLRKEFAAQLLFEMFTRFYLRHPLKWRFFRLFLKCKTFPRYSDMKQIWMVFNSSRNKHLQAAFDKGCDFHI